MRLFENGNVFSTEHEETLLMIIIVEIALLCTRVGLSAFSEVSKIITETTVAQNKPGKGFLLINVVLQ